MERPFRRVRLLSLILLSAVVASGARAAAIEKKDQFQVAALALPGGLFRKHGAYFFCQLPLL